MSGFLSRMNGLAVVVGQSSVHRHVVARKFVRTDVTIGN
jgi:hypothetical protein